MSVSINDINAALVQKLNAVTSLDIAFYGSQFTPSPNEDYIKETPAITDNEVALSGDTETYTGIYTLVVCTPKADGKFYNGAKVDAIKNTFGRGLDGNIESNGQKVSIYKATVGSMFQDDTHIKTPITIDYTVIG